MSSLASVSIWRRLVSRVTRNRSAFMNLKSPGLYLDIGCGPKTRPENINLDYRWRPGVDVCCDISKGLPFPDEYVVGIYSEHCLEHISFAAARFVFKEFRRVLRPGGHVRIIVPDLEIYVDRYDLFRSTGEMSMPYGDEDAVENIYSPSMSINRVFRAHGHQFIYDFDTLAKMLGAAGFVDVVKLQFGVGKDANLLLDSEERAIESLYVEARKPP
jgi:predicted SAM-dependent methyltransferase